jgi:hypothetical protein
MAPLALSVAAIMCGAGEDAERSSLRARLKQPARLTPEELTRVLDEVAHSLAGRSVQFVRNGSVENPTDQQRDIVLGMLSEPAGVFDEGLRIDERPSLRVLNAPGRSANRELDAARKLFIDTDTLLPRKFEFVSGDASEEFSLEILVKE